MGLLLLDDQKAARLLLRAFLVRLGVPLIEEASNSISALRLLTATSPLITPFKAVFVSRMLPEMTGLEFVKTVRQLPGWELLPLIVISEDPSAIYEAEAHEAGASHYLLRPYLEEELKSILYDVNAMETKVP